MLLAIAALFLLGLCAGSFVNALVWRVHEQSTHKKKIDKNLSVINGRSICPNCRHKLSASDLIPLLSWLTLGGRCRYCKKEISYQYPIVELSSGLIFAASYIFWPAQISGAGELMLFISWLFTAVGLLSLLIYDYRWMLLPNRILYPTAFVAITGRGLYIVLTDADKMTAVVDWGLSLAVASGVFWLIFQVSRGKWIGYGDVRLGIITGTLLATPSKSLLMIFTASLLGTLFVMPSLLRGQRSATTRIPYGPFLIAATFLVLLFGQPAIDWYVGLNSQG